MEDAIETIERDGFRLQIFVDPDPTSPDDFDKIGERIFSSRHIENVARDLVRKYGSFWYREITSNDRGYRIYILPKAKWIAAGNPRKDGPAYCESVAEAWQQYCDGEVYGYSVSMKSENDCPCEQWEEKDSCWGFYGFDHCMEEGKGMLKHFLSKEQEGKAFEKFGMAI